MILTSALAILMMQAAAPKGAQPALQPLTKASTEARVKASFEAMDTNKDGSVDKAEAERSRDNNVAILQKQRGDQISGHFARLDTNKNGALSREEFDAFFSRIQVATNLPWLTNNDLNKDGRVSLAELTSQAMATFDRLDTDRNGVLSARESAAAQQAPRPQPKASPAGR
jgi:hypothetical protein